MEECPDLTLFLNSIPYIELGKPYSRHRKHYVDYYTDFFVIVDPSTHGKGI